MTIHNSRWCKNVEKCVNIDEKLIRWLRHGLVWFCLKGIEKRW